MPFPFLGMPESSLKSVRAAGNFSCKSRLELIHRHYTDVLFDVLKRRCRDSQELSETCKKLGDFFGALRLVYRVHRHYLRSLDFIHLPFRSIRGNSVITVQEALTCKDDHEFTDFDEFDVRSPMTYNLACKFQ